MDSLLCSGIQGSRVRVNTMFLADESFKALAEVLRSRWESNHVLPHLSTA